MAEIKKAAKAGNQAVAATYAKQLVRLRAQRDKSHKVSASIKGVGMRTTVRLRREIIKRFADAIPAL